MDLFDKAYHLLRDTGLDHTSALYGNLAINLVVIAILAVLLHIICKKLLVIGLNIVAQRTKTTFDDFLVENKTPRYLAYVAPVLLLYYTLPEILADFKGWLALTDKLLNIFIIVLTLWIIRSVLNSIRDYLKQLPGYNDKPIDSYIQVIMIVLWIFAVTAIIMSLFGVKIDTLLTTFGAISAIVLLIFKDTILGFVASIQVSVNDMVRIGDWITSEKFGADGDVIEINLATVKVRNFDNTTTTIPTYSLITDSFTNWRGMQNSGGRRIKRHILIKPSSVRFINPEELESFRKIQLLASYIDHRQAEIEKYNAQHNVDKTIQVNGRNLTNLGLFRKYISRYVENHPGLNKEMTMMCRHLQPTEKGIPLEIYVFSADKRWVNYEYIMADIFDHVIASVRYFDLEIFELPSSGQFFSEE